MGKKQASGGKKKKGPKGKKARAKAKLERQWGEQLTEEQVNVAKKNRRGTLRNPNHGLITTTSLLGKDNVDRHHPLSERKEGFEQPTSSQLTRRKDVKRNDESSRSDDDDDDDDLKDQQDTFGNSFQSLLNAIQRNSSVRRKVLENDEYEAEENERHHLMQADVCEDYDLDLQDTVIEDVDLFGLHFNKPPLQNDDVATESMVKIPMESVVDSLEIQISSELFNELKTLSSSSSFLTTSVSQLNWRRLVKVSLTGVRKILMRKLRQESSIEGGRHDISLLSPLQRILFPLVARYADVLWAAETRHNREQVSSLVLLHVLNHVLTSRSRIQRHNQRLKEIEKDDETGTKGHCEFRDQGFTRPTVLVLLPTRSTCLSFVKGMLQLLGSTPQVENLERFEAEFGVPTNPTDHENKGVIDAEAERRRKIVLEKKGRDWLELFGDDVNDDDDFKIGISITPKVVTKSSSSTRDTTNGQDEYSNVSIKLFTDFYRSDIILASPLALKLLQGGTDGDEEEDTDYDFLSSIEICVMARMDVLLMQNIDHVNGVLSMLNHQPKKNNNTDFSRVREYFLEGQSARWRQLIACSEFTDPQILSTFKRFSRSHAGSVKMKIFVTSDDCCIEKILLPVNQVFQRVSCSSIADIGQAKVKYFAEKLLPPILQRKQKYTMVFIPSYFDFIALRNVLLKKEVEFVSVSEYSRVSEVTRSRARFLQGLKPILLYTGRAHYFSRHTMKGVKHVIFIGLPEHSQFYVDLIHSLGDGLQQHDDADTNHHSSFTCLALFTKYDAHSLERIVGAENCRKMVKSDKSAFTYTS